VGAKRSSATGGVGAKKISDLFPKGPLPSRKLLILNVKQRRRDQHSHFDFRDWRESLQVDGAYQDLESRQHTPFRRRVTLQAVEYTRLI
jgi:hypothetical protein